MDNVLLKGTEVQQSSKVRTAVLYESSKDHQSRAKHMLAKVQQHGCDLQHSSKVHVAVDQLSAEHFKRQFSCGSCLLIMLSSIASRQHCISGL